ncbi:hypothetical protein [Alteromonas oceanisediminis]|uniref:hypothetical protein n=1 Tax=Alteromonas oceanisediminis TaxID=2836180 RepID=UPI001BD98C7F|nr:hypothetical protein [Alteromonas oceanisediminis]MBT0587963.1 hypothetical protein [Alteromonas oceanisediminis]
MEEVILRSAGDFPNKSVVEYATVVVKLRMRDIPESLQNEHCHEDSIVHLFLSSNLRLTFKEMYLDSKELAQKFKEFADIKLKKRTYTAKTFVEVRTSTRKITTTAMRAKHSIAVRALLEGK